VFYYDSSELSYLKRLQEQHKKNCNHTPGEKEKSLWAPAELVQGLKGLNLREELGLGEGQVELMVSRLKDMFEASCSSRLGKLRESCSSRVQKVSRTSQNSVPYELVQVTRAHER
jgi:hypothetical protein